MNSRSLNIPTESSKTNAAIIAMVTNEKCPLQFFPVKEECASERVRKNLSVRNADKSLLTCYTCMLQLLYIFVDKIYLKVTFIICNSFSKECPRANNFK